MNTVWERGALGTSRGTIQRLVEQEGIERQTSQKLSPEQREEAFRLLDEGYRSGRWPGSLA